MGGISITQLLIIASIVVVLFGTKKLRGLGSDLGASIKGFKKSMSEDDNTTSTSSDKSSQDADFTAPPIEPKANLACPDEAKNKDKEHV
ncbi:Sec-independent protein translocase protein TatA [Sodalis glossinidius str. 'morsitans']|uniref:Sec-independent protein translocase protein TatA n=2 Tax=Sodalis glossinidius (strain morsitans) TaxID=343509 RepID=TATA_SODGM|nr:twin-arginine translocase TatA/TatE family subunit [Sodalis glossinidius]Q2NWT8.1 RecName: Full=Sec-independent protein translocase protein TatA [Sodalis glossinidius str. 'morsitans']BAE73387.1 sec-independent protein translocase protein TatA [Sodalis glossinidius str. 'morsitans']CRL43732.1 Sec-independent protein translocase protein TatA [Sodalis glossinidius str. 'morsitans']